MRLKCTYCGGEDFYEGPSGGLSTNVLCANPECRHWFNDTPMGLEDLNRIESTDEEKAIALKAAEERVQAGMDRKYEEGKRAFLSGKTSRSLRSNDSYSTMDMSHLCGFIDAIAEKIRMG